MTSEHSLFPYLSLPFQPPPVPPPFSPITRFFSAADSFFFPPPTRSESHQSLLRTNLEPPIVFFFHSASLFDSKIPSGQVLAKRTAVVRSPPPSFRRNKPFFFSNSYECSLLPFSLVVAFFPLVLSFQIRFFFFPRPIFGSSYGRSVLLSLRPSSFPFCGLPV